MNTIKYIEEQIRRNEFYPEVVDIIYGTGDMTEIEFVMEYRCEGFLGSDNVLRRPPYLGMCF